jgi:hypothetical protein
MRKQTTEEALHELGCAFTRRADGLYEVPHDIKIGYSDITELPNLSDVIVKGNFTCPKNRLTSLKGCPREVEGDFWCDRNQLTSLEGCPQKVGGNFLCNGNNLTSLAHAPPEIGGYFFCEKNKLESLADAPKKFLRLDSDFGSFESWDKIPDNIRRGPAVVAQEAEERAAHDTLERLKKVANDHKLKLKKPAIK